MDTPAALEAYFAHLVTESPKAKWRAGLTAAQQWCAYHDQAGNDGTPLVEILAVLLPYRHDGSGLLGLWQAVIGAVQQLPAAPQLACWSAVYALPGNPPLHGRQQASRLLTIWDDWIRQVAHERLEGWQMEAAARSVGIPLPVAHELLALAWAMDTWCLAQRAELRWMALLFGMRS